MHPVNPLSGNVPYFIILLCLMPDNFTRQGESAVTQWDNGLIKTMTYQAETIACEQALKVK
jgi:hypothetical protein